MLKVSGMVEKCACQRILNDVSKKKRLMVPILSLLGASPYKLTVSNGHHMRNQ
jgi:hypothetical protein